MNNTCTELSSDRIYDIIREIGWYLDPYDINDEDYALMHMRLIADEKSTLRTFFETTDVDEMRECLIESGDDKELADYNLLYDYYTARYC